jgi:hypothetical protein
VFSVRVVRIIARPLRRRWVRRMSRHDVRGLLTGAPSTGGCGSAVTKQCRMRDCGVVAKSQAALFDDRREFELAGREEEKVEIGPSR